MIAALFYPFDHDFMVRALIACLVTGIAAPMVGTFIVQRNLSLIGDGLGHVAAAGVGIALWLNIAPRTVSLIATVLAACAIEWIFHASRNSDTALAIIFYSGIAASVTFAGRSSQQSQLQQYLFGSLLTVTRDDVVIITLVCIGVALAVFFLRRLFLAIAIDESSAHVAGVPIHVLHVMLTSAVALIVSASMTVTGVLLISAVMVVPVMSAHIWGRNFSHTWVLSTIIGGCGSVLGLALSRIVDTPAGGTIVLTHIAIFIVFTALSAFTHRMHKSSHIHHNHTH